MLSHPIKSATTQETEQCSSQRLSTEYAVVEPNLAWRQTIDTKNVAYETAIDASNSY